MATITGAQQEKVIPLKNWLGLHECPDGDTGLKVGEAAVMRNFRVTRDGNLQKRPGLKQLVSLGVNPVHCLWSGYINGVEHLLAAANNRLYSLWDASAQDFYATPVDLGATGATAHAHIFGFNNMAYILTGTNYMRYDGTTLTHVVAYVPLVAVSVPPAGGGETLEQVNKLTATRRIWVSPNGTDTVFHLPETNLASIDAVRKTSTGEVVSGHTRDAENGTVTFAAAPAAGTNTLEIQYTVTANYRSELNSMKYSELFNGSMDTRVFVYGDGTNRAFYSGIDYEGNPRAEYFPDLNVITVGESNTPITSLIRHYSTMIAYKDTSSWSVQYGEISLADGSSTAAFYVKPINRIIGNAAMGQAQLVLNSPRTVFGGDIYEWKNNSSYSSNLSVDERQARRISDRVFKTVSGFELAKVKTCDSNTAQEYFIWQPGGNKVLVHNYALDAWYLYTGLPVYSMLEFKGRQLAGTAGGYLCELDGQWLGDTIGGVTKDIDCRWESGSMDFGAEYMRKYSAITWLAVQPASHSSISMTVLTDRSNSLTERTVETSLVGFDRIDFTAFTFENNRRPQIKRLKLKAKKFVYYKLILESCNNNASATVTDAEIKVRYTGYAK